MKPILEVIVLGDPAAAEVDDPRWSHTLRVIPARVSAVAELPEAAAAGRLMEGEGDFVALAPDAETRSLRTIGMFAFLLTGESSSESSAFVQNKRISEFPSVTEHLLECFSPGMREIDTVLFCRKAFREVGPLRSVSDPVWDWLIRVTRAGRKFNPWPPSDAQRVDWLPMLTPPAPDSRLDWLREHLGSTPFQDAKSRPRSKIDETALRAGLFQWHDFLDESHQLSQSIEGEGENRLGDYWHAIMHRREPDYSNAKYWFRQIGPHTIFRELRRQADLILEKCPAPEAADWRARLGAQARWDPFAFVDLCQKCAADEESELAIAARRIQLAEMSLLTNLTCGV